MPTFDEQVRAGFENIKPNEESVIVPSTPIIEDVVTEPVAEVVEETVVETQPNIIAYFKEQMGYSGDLDGDDIDTLIQIAKAARPVDTIDPRYQAFKEHLDKGGNEESYLEMQPTTTFKGLVVDEGDVDLQVQIAKIAATQLNGFSDEKADSFITKLKDGGGLFDYVETNLGTLAGLEERDNQQRAKAIEDELLKTKQDNETYFSNIDTSFKDKKLVGITSLEFLNDVHAASVPNGKGELGIDDILDQVGSKPELVATANYMMWCLINKKSFNFNPAVVRTGSKVSMQEVFNKKSGSGEKGGSIAELENILNNKR